MLVELFSGIEQDLNQVQNRMIQVLKSDQRGLLDQIISYLLQKQGKMIRPALVILSGRICQAHREDLIPLGVGVELLHMATLIHDDIIDEATERRGLQTINKRFNSRLAVLVGDYFYARSLSQFAHLNSEGFERVANIISNLVRGEFIQYENSFKKDQDFTEYWNLIDQKTAFFISSCCQLGAMAGQSSRREVTALTRYGQKLGLAFQICDDLLDFAENPTSLGKSTNKDVVNGIYTLPILHALKYCKQQKVLRQLLEKDQLTQDHFLELRDLLKKTGSLDYAYQLEKKLCAQARRELQIFPESYERKTLESLTQFNLRREF